MDARITEGRLSLNVADLIEKLDDDGRQQVIQTLACQAEVIEAVAQQIVSGWTEAGNHGYTSYGPMPHTALDKARRLVAKSASDNAKAAIERLEQIAVDAEKRACEFQTKLIELERKWYDRTGQFAC